MLCFVMFTEARLLGSVKVTLCIPANDVAWRSHKSLICFSQSAAEISPRRIEARKIRLWMPTISFVFAMLER